MSQIHVSQADIFKSLAHPTRLRILNLLREGERCVCEIMPPLEMEQSNVSRHLAILKKEGILSSRKEGLKVIYEVNDPKVFDILDLCSEILNSYWQTKIQTGS